MDAGPVPLEASLDVRLWPLIEDFLDSHRVPGLAVGVVRDEEIVLRGFGVRDIDTRTPVTPETMFHLASVSKPFVATAVVTMSTAWDGGAQVVELDAPIVEWVPEFTLADGRHHEVTARGLLTHTSGLPDVADYGWHDPQLGDDALSEFARSLSGWRLQTDPGAAFSYSNAGFELLGLLLARAAGTTFEDAVNQRLLEPLAMRTSTFLRGEVPADLAASPHVGMPLSVPEGGYPYTRRHAPSSTLHSNLVEMCRWMQAHFVPPEGPSDARSQATRLDPQLIDLMWRPAITVDEPPWEEEQALGWCIGTYGGHRTLSHSGADPGFGSKLVLVPGCRAGVVVLANSNIVPAGMIAAAALDVALADVTRDASAGVTPAEPGTGLSRMRALLPPVVGPVAATLTTSGPDAAAAAYHRLAALEPAEFDLGDEGFEDAVWGAIELHRAGMVWPLLRLWTSVRPDSSAAWTMTGWAHQIEGNLELARSLLQRALDLDPDNEDAMLILGNVPST